MNIYRKQKDISLYMRYTAGTFILAVSILFLCVMPVLASTLISQGYSASASVPLGSIVSVSQSSANVVTAANVKTAANILGVVIDSSDSQVSLSSAQNNQVQVATSGVEEVLVSDINGSIEAGDPITASPIAGVGMQASENIKVVGFAQGTFPNNSAKQESYTDQSGQKHSIMLGEVPVLVDISYYYKQPDKTLIPPAIQSLADALAGKTVSPLPILVSIGIFIVALVVVSSIIYSLIHSSVISVGRNPMAQSAIYRNVIQLSAVIIVILAVAVILINVVLTRF